MVSERGPHRAFFAVSALLFAASAAVTIFWCASMSATATIPVSGGWTISKAWMRMPGQGWPGAAASFVGMWVVMMVAMMLPSLVRLYAGLSVYALGLLLLAVSTINFAHPAKSGINTRGLYRRRVVQ